MNLSELIAIKGMIEGERRMGNASAYEQLSTLERERVDHEAAETLQAAFDAAHSAVGWSGDIMVECWQAGLPVMKEAMAKLVLSYRASTNAVKAGHGDEVGEKLK